MAISDHDKLKCAERELRMRKKTYPRWVNSGQMTAAQAAHEIECMTAIAEDYRKACGEDDLFKAIPG